MTQITTLIVALKTITMVLGGLITYYAYKAYRRTKAPPLQFFALGFGIITVGSMIAGIFDLATHLPRNIAITTESTLTVIGFAVIIFSLYTE